MRARRPVRSFREPESPEGFPGSLVSERSLFNIGFYLGLGFLCAQLVFAIVLFIAAVLIFGLTL